jgi:hypothetical protein
MLMVEPTRIERSTAVDEKQRFAWKAALTDRPSPRVTRAEGPGPTVPEIVGGSPRRPERAIEPLSRARTQD